MHLVRHSPNFCSWKDRTVAAMMGMIREDLALLNVHHDVFFSERSLIEGRDEVADTIATLRAKGFVYEGSLPPPKGKIDEALKASRESNSPAGRILAAGLERRNEGTERVMKAIENVGLIEMASLERGLVWLATVSNVAPLLGFLGTVIGMIVAFQNIEAAGEVEATLVAGGIKIALITTAAGLIIAIPMSIMHNYFVSKVDRMVIDMEESAQRMIDALQEIGGTHARA